MQVTIVPDNANSIEIALQTLLGQRSLTIRCTLRGERLIVMGQHNDDVALDPKNIFWFLENALHTLHLEFVQQVGLYLGIAGEAQPYARRYFPLERSPLRLALPPATEQEEGWALSDEDLDDWMQELVYSAAQVNPFAHTVTVEGLQPITLADLEPITVESTPLPENDLEQQIHDRFAVVAAVATVGLLTSGYVFTRPCALGTCPEITQAQTLQQQAVELARQSSSPEAMVNARQPLQRAIATLEVIPDWSPKAEQVKTLHHHYQVDSLMLDELITVQRLIDRTTRAGGLTAGVKGWEQVRSTWQTAVDRLGKIPPESHFYGIAQEKLAQYQGNLKQAEMRFRAEQQAQGQLDRAKLRLRDGIVAEQAAQTEDDWQQVRSIWQDGMEQLQRIPANTTVAIEARRLLEVYRFKLSTLSQRATQQQLAAQVLTRAAQQAIAAQSAQQRRDWRVAIATWTEALTTLSTLPPGTPYQPQAEAMAIAYQQALYQSQRQIPSGSEIIATAYRVCARELQACTPITVDTAIRVQLNATYARAIATAQASASPRLQNSTRAQQQVFDQAMQRLANQARLPVEVMQPSGELFKHYPPQETS